MELIATCMFGLEKFVGEDIASLGYERTETIDGRVSFSVPDDDYSAIARANIFSRYAERILIKVGSFRAVSFDELYDNVKALNWSKYIAQECAFPVKGSRVRSVLASVPDSQRIIKKAVADNLGMKYALKTLPETGTIRQIEFFILNDIVTMMIDTSGDGLHKRGYRAVSGAAPIKETLAATIARISRPREGVATVDPFAGSGTLLIEAAMMMRRIAPGAGRGFAAEQFEFIPESIWRDAREEARAGVTDSDIHFYGYDIDGESINIAKNNARKAGVGDLITFQKRDVADFDEPYEGARGTVITNPPYGERLGDLEGSRRLILALGQRMKEKTPMWQAYVISPDMDFERYFGRRSDKKRPIHNGNIKCTLYQFFRNTKLTKNT